MIRRTRFPVIAILRPENVTKGFIYYYFNFVSINQFFKLINRKKTTENTTNELQTIGNSSGVKKKKTTNQTNSNRSKSTSIGKPSKASLGSIASTCSTSTITQSTTTTPIIKSESPLVATCSQSSTSSVSSAIDGHMTSEELERHLESRRQPLAMLMPEKTPLTVPVELFSNESSNGLPDDDNNHLNLKLSQ